MNRPEFNCGAARMRQFILCGGHGDKKKAMVALQQVELDA
jgi:hypothetical protein